MSNFFYLDESSIEEHVQSEVHSEVSTDISISDKDDDYSIQSNYEFEVSEDYELYTPIHEHVYPEVHEPTDYSYQNWQYDRDEIQFQMQHNRESYAGSDIEGFGEEEAYEYEDSSFASDDSRYLRMMQILRDAHEAELMMDMEYSSQSKTVTMDTQENSELVNDSFPYLDMDPENSEDGREVLYDALNNNRFLQRWVPSCLEVKFLVMFEAVENSHPDGNSMLVWKLWESTGFINQEISGFYNYPIVLGWIEEAGKFFK